MDGRAELPHLDDLIPKILGFLAFAGWAFAVISGRRNLRFTPQMGWAFAFLFVTLLYLMFAVYPGAGSTETISYVLYIMFLAIFVQSIRTEKEINRCLGVYAFAIAVGTFYGLATFTAGVAHLAWGRSLTPTTTPRRWPAGCRWPPTSPAMPPEAAGCGGSARC